MSAVFSRVWKERKQQQKATVKATKKKKKNKTVVTLQSSVIACVKLYTTDNTAAETDKKRALTVLENETNTPKSDY